MASEARFILELFSNEGQWFWQALGAVIVGASLVAVYRQVKLQRMAGMVDAIEKLVMAWNSESQLRLRLAVCEKMKTDITYFGDDTEELLELFERIGAYVRFGALSERAVWDVFSWYIDHYYELARSGLTDLRKHHKDRLLFENFEWLAIQLSNTSRSKGLPSHILQNQIDARNFLDAEINTAKILLGLEFELVTDQ